MTATTTPTSTATVTDAVEYGIKMRLACTWLNGEGAGGAIPDWINALAPRVVELLDERQAQALRDAARDLDVWGDPDCTPATWLRARAAGCNCGAPGICHACGAILCVDCNVGEPSRCTHGNGPLCVGCDVETCAGCYHELQADRGTFTGRWDR